MQLEHSFTVPTDIEQAWAVLLDIERIAPCMPGATLESVDGDEFTGAVKVKLGPINLTYKGKAQFVEKDAAAHRVLIDARGKDARGAGTAAAKITATLADAEGATQVHVQTDLDITGKPAQFGRGVLVDVGNKIIGQFASCLAEKLAAGPQQASADTTEPTEQPAAAPESVTAPANTETTAPARSASPPREVEPIDLLESAGPAVAKRLAPVAIALVVLLAILRRRHTCTKRGDSA